MKEIIDFKELAKRLGVHLNTTYALRAQGMPHFAVGKKKQFRADYQEVLEWLQNRHDLRGSNE